MLRVEYRKTSTDLSNAAPVSNLRFSFRAVMPSLKDLPASSSTFLTASRACCTAGVTFSLLDVFVVICPNVVAPSAKIINADVYMDL